MTRGLCSLLPAAAWLLVLAPGVVAQPEPARKPFVIFAGTVLEVAASASPEIPRSARTIVVRVDEVAEKPKAVALARGDRVTIEVRDPAPFKAGVRATFHAASWIFGDMLGLREISHEILAAGATASMDEARAEAEKVRRQASDEALRARIREAQMVIVGRVTAVRAATMDQFGAPARRIVTEHDPQLMEAIVRVSSAIKGASEGQTVVIRFPSSRDVAWRDAPKFRVNQQGTFLLDPEQISGTPRAMLAGTEVVAYMAPGAGDVLPVQDASRVRALAGQ